ncbi:acyl-CoA dehydrogenase family protein [Mycolicibacterium stellerae]|uniref:acyl-CoA dehydrogenase family protein n=1 Tax=Mycolicibacterium stellerae TaxID=2358193 RepID=UPI000F0B0819|nr:acyl-CoA dehydrogenase family protein [Mycolicibacterium stellerae]
MDLSTKLVERAHELAPLVASEAEKTEQLGEVPRVLIDQFCSAGFMKVLVPKCYGGYELGVDTMSRIVRAIAPSCSSTAWVLAFYIGHNFLHSLFPERSQQEVFADRSFALSPGTAAPQFKMEPVDGGYLVTGRSSWNSGSAAAEWYLAGGFASTEAGARNHVLFLVPASDAKAVDNWDVAAMRGTSSDDMVLDNVFVPEYRTADATRVMSGDSPGSRLHSNAMYSMPVMPLLLAEVLPIIVGAYRAVVDEYTAFVESRQGPRFTTRTPGKQLTQIKVGRGKAGADLADAMLDDYLRVLTTTPSEILRDPVTRAGLKARVATITDFCAEGIDVVVQAAGAEAFRSKSPLQRFFRDISMLRVHAYLDLENASETYGRLLFGLPPESPI